VRLVQEILSVGSRCDLKATHVIFRVKPTMLTFP
jgi:hypothetical protein